MAIQYRLDATISPEQLAALFEASGIRRPTGDLNRIGRMIQGANLTVTAWDEQRLIGVARALTDFVWCCYLSDLAVDRVYQHQGIGRELVRQVRDNIDARATLVLISAPEAMAYYPKIGLEPMPNCWISPRRD